MKIYSVRNNAIKSTSFQNEQTFTALKMPDYKVLKKELPSVYLQVENTRPQLNELAKDTKIFITPHCGDIFINVGSFNPKVKNAKYPYEHAILYDAEKNKDIKSALIDIVKRTKETYIKRMK